MFILERTANANADGDADVVGQTQAEPEGGAADTRRWLLLDRVAGRVISPTPPLDHWCWSLLWATGGGGGSVPVPPCAELGGFAWHCGVGGLRWPLSPQRRQWWWWVRHAFALIGGGPNPQHRRWWQESSSPCRYGVCVCDNRSSV